jgi:CRP-like cAMP-binding protein
VPPTPNLLLASLPKAAAAAIRPHLKLIELRFGEVVAESGSRIKTACFPLTAVISLVVELASGQMIETAMVGCDGVVNGGAALDGKMSLHKSIVQLAGSVLTIPAEDLAQLADDHAPLRALVIRNEQFLLAQSQQSVACNAVHDVESRMCRWLLRMRDLTDSSELTVTQDFLAQMLGVTRPTVSIIAATLQKAGYIRYRRGSIRVLDVAGLKEGSCECYESVRLQYERMLKPRKLS